MEEESKEKNVVGDEEIITQMEADREHEEQIRSIMDTF